jgi:hypothetical protein
MKKLAFIFLLLSALQLQAQDKNLSSNYSQQVVHHVFFYLKYPQSVQDKNELKEGLKTLESIQEVKKLLIGEPASTLQRDVVVSDWHVSEIIYFESIEDQDAYQVDPIHQRFVENYGHLWDKVVDYDMLVD